MRAAAGKTLVEPGDTSTATFIPARGTTDRRHTRSMLDPLDAFRRVWFVDLPDPEPHELNASVWHRAIDGGLWAVGLGAIDEESMGWYIEEEVLAMHGSALEGVGWLLVQDGVRLPDRLHQWSVARDVPAADIGPGRCKFVEVDGLPYLAMCWRYDDVDAYVATVGRSELVAFVPAGETVRVVTTYHR
jgi:hypothetical protein